MNIGTIGSFGNQNSIFNVNGINQTVNRRNEAAGIVKPQDQDKLSLTPQGKKQSLLSNLMKQRQDLIERKGELMASNAEKGGSAMDIKSQTDLIEEQIKNLDEQISKASAEEAEPEKETEGKNIYDKPKTEEEARNEQLASLTQMTASIASADIVASVKSRVDGEARVLKAEIKSGYGNIEKKQENLAELEAQSKSLLEKTGEYINEANENLKDSRQPEATEADEAAEATDPEELQETTQGTPMFPAGN